MINRIALVALLATLASSAFAQNTNRNTGTGISQAELALFEQHDFQGMPYRLLLPIDYNPGKEYPLILNLHGRSGIGDDNESQLRSWSKVFTDPSWRKKYRCDKTSNVWDWLFSKQRQ